MKRKEENSRKVRSDKKIDVKPTVPIQLRNCIADLYIVTGIPIKDIVEQICMDGMRSELVMEHLSKHFKRDYNFRTDTPYPTLYRGNNELAHARYIIRKELVRRRISTRFTKEFYESIYELSNALDMTPSSTTGFLLEISVKDISIIDRFIKPYTSEFEDYEKKIMRGVIRYVNKDNPFTQNLKFKDILRYILEWLKEN